MEKDVMENGNKLIANAGGWKLVTNYPPDVYERGSEKLTSISFHKAKLFDKLMEVVNKLEQTCDLYITIKRKECAIEIMRLTANQKIIHREGNTKQDAVWLSVVEYLENHYNSSQLNQK